MHLGHLHAPHVVRVVKPPGQTHMLLVLLLACILKSIAAQSMRSHLTWLIQ